jgi:DNA-directed RNA polymerase subunit RPC12/RpoP
MVDEVNLVGSRVSTMHLAYDCTGCASAVAVSMSDGKHPDGHRLLVQRPRDCPNCGERIVISVVAEAPQGDPVAH